MTDLPRLDLGSILRGALRPQDLASALLDFDKYLGRVITGKLAEIVREEDGRDDSNDSEVIADAIDALQEYAPPFCYVGFHERDGSDLGVWFDHDYFEDACRDGEVLKISDLSELDDMSPSSLEAECIALVNDHGNVTLYWPRIAVTKIWEIA